MGLTLALVLPSSRVEGAQTTSLAVTATVVNNCSISAGGIAFAPYDPGIDNATADLEGEGQLTIACTKGASPAIALGAGVNAAGRVRRLADGDAMLVYELYRDSGRTTVWGDGPGALLTGVAVSRMPRDFAVYARIPAGQDVPGGSYSDTIVATVNF